MGRCDRARLQVRAARSHGGRETAGDRPAACEARGERGPVTAGRHGEPRVRRQIGRVLALVWAERRLYLPGCVFVAVSILTGLTYPLVIRWIIDDGIQGGRVDRLNQLALILVAILVGE